MMSELLSIADAALQIRQGRLTPSELLRQCLDSIRRYEDRVNAWVMVDEEGAQKAAEALGRQEPRGPLHGIPVGIKDIVDVEGLPTRAGSPLREGHVARADAPVVAALRRAGAIILGKTVTVEFACFDSPPTRNPWDPDLQHTPGGSSSGSAVAVAMGMCLGAIGTQTGGSLVRPSSYCGIATCKPTFGRLDRTGIVPVSYHLDHAGPMARTVGDVEITLRCLLDRGDSAAREAAREVALPPRLGVLEQFFLEEADESVRRVTQAAIAKLGDAGAEIETLTFPGGFEQVQAIHRQIMSVEAAACHRRQFAAHRDAYGPMITELLDEGLRSSAVDYATALAQQRGFRYQVNGFLDANHTIDALIVPSTRTPAPATLAHTGTSEFQAPWSLAGVPVVSMPSGLSADGMPIGLQLVGRTDRESDLIQVARWCEQILEFDALPPLLI